MHAAGPETRGLEESNLPNPDSWVLHARADYQHRVIGAECAAERVCDAEAETAHRARTLNSTSLPH